MKLSILQLKLMTSESCRMLLCYNVNMPCYKILDLENVIQKCMLSPFSTLRVQPLLNVNLLPRKIDNISILGSLDVISVL